MNMTKPAIIHLDSLMNPDGFLNDPQLWTEDIATAIAHQDSLPVLTHDHWVVIHELRKHYQRFGAALPAFSHICNLHHLGKHCVGRLFRSEREAWRISGLPDPGEEAKAYL